MRTILICLLALFFAASANAGNEKTIMRLNLSPGETYYHNTTTQTNMLQDLMGMQINLVMRMGGTVAFTVMADLGDAYEMEAQYLALNAEINTSMEMMGQTIENSVIDDEMVEFFDSFTHRPFMVIMSKKGEVLEVSGMDRVIEQSMIDMPFGSYDERMEVITQMKSIAGDQSIAGNLELVSVVFPDQPVAVGEKWNTHTRVTGGFSADFLNTFEIKELQKDYILIGGNSLMSTDENERSFDYFETSMDVEMNGTMHSTLKIDRLTGWIIHSDIYQELDGWVTMGESNDMPEGVEVKIKSMSRTLTSGNPE
jgi:hypothetical protein